MKVFKLQYGIISATCELKIIYQIEIINKDIYKNNIKIFIKIE